MIDESTLTGCDCESCKITRMKLEVGEEKREVLEALNKLLESHFTDLGKESFDDITNLVYKLSNVLDEQMRNLNS